MESFDSSKMTIFCRPVHRVCCASFGPMLVRPLGNVEMTAGDVVAE